MFDYAYNNQEVEKREKISVDETLIKFSKRDLRDFDWIKVEGEKL